MGNFTCSHIVLPNFSALRTEKSSDINQYAVAVKYLGKEVRLILISIIL